LRLACCFCGGGVPEPGPSSTPTTTRAITGDAIHSGDTIFLRTRSGNGNHIDVEGSAVQSRWVSRGTWQAVVIEKASGGAISSGDTVYLKTHTGTHIDVTGDVVQARWNEKGDWQAMVIEKRKQVRQDAREFMHLCQMLDPEKTGYISWTDFEREMHNEVMVAYMASVDLEVHDVELFFHIVTGSSEHGKCRIDHFVDGCMQMKGPANAMDMQKQLFEIDELRREVVKTRKETLAFLKDLV